jgi:hypothetical protein
MIRITLWFISILLALIVLLPGCVSSQQSQLSPNSSIVTSPMPTVINIPVLSNSIPAAPILTTEPLVPVNSTSPMRLLSDCIHDLQPTLETNESTIFGGLWIQYTPKSKLIIAFTRDGENTLQKYKSIISPEVIPYVEIRNVKYTLATLLRDQDKFVNDLHNLGIAFISEEVIVMSNRVEITLNKADQANLNNFTQSQKLVVPQTVWIIYFPFGTLGNGMGPIPGAKEPRNGAKGVSLLPMISWYPIPGATGYDFQLATDQNFTRIVDAKNNIKNTFYVPTSELMANTIYYWEIRGLKDTTATEWFTGSFMTQQ